MIGVLGASGAVGSAAVAELHRLGVGPLRLGARRRKPLDRLAAGLPAGQVEVVEADATDPESLAAFSAGCTLVLNCAGPTYQLRDTVAVAALSAGAHCVDVAGDDPAHDGLRERGLAGTDRSVLLSAGTLPGLSSLVPRWLAADAFDKPEALTAYVGGIEPCSPVVAVDMMLSLQTGGADGGAYGRANAAWRDGALRSGALRSAEGTEAPMFTGTVALQPFLSTETVRLGQALRLDRVDWFNVYPGSQVWSVLAALPAATRQGTDADVLAARLVRAAELDLAGLSPYYQMVFSMRGTLGGEAAYRTAVLRTPNSYRLTGLVGALATATVLAGAVPAGVHYACDVLEAAPLVEAVRRSGALSVFSVVAGEAGTEEGDL